MKANTHSEKEILIFNAVTKLINDGTKIHTIKVADIAKVAGIGKGTIYDYFKSKEEILEKAILYHMNEELYKALEEIKSSCDFKSKYYKILEMTQNNIVNYHSSANLLSSVGTYELKEVLVNNIEEVKNRENIINKTINDIVNLGIKEGIIKNQDDKTYQEQVFKSTIMGFAHYIVCENIIDTLEIEKGKDRAYKLLIKGLN